MQQKASKLDRDPLDQDGLDSVTIYGWIINDIAKQKRGWTQMQ